MIEKVKSKQINKSEFVYILVYSIVGEYLPQLACVLERNEFLEILQFKKRNYDFINFLLKHLTNWYR